jgi:hypothetical protein
MKQEKSRTIAIKAGIVFIKTPFLSTSLARGKDHIGYAMVAWLENILFFRTIPIRRDVLAPAGRNRLGFRRRRSFGNV